MFWSELCPDNYYFFTCRLSNCHLGQAQNMKLFCKYLMKNKSIEELRYDPLPPPSIALKNLDWEITNILNYRHHPSSAYPLFLILAIAFLIMAFVWIASLSCWTLYSSAPMSKSYCTWEKILFILLFIWYDIILPILRLRNNLIGQECASKIKDFLAGATLDSLVSVNISNCIDEYSYQIIFFFFFFL